MISPPALRRLLGAMLVAGAVDLAVINVVLAPRVIGVRDSVASTTAVAGTTVAPPAAIAARPAMEQITAPEVSAPPAPPTEPEPPPPPEAPASAHAGAQVYFATMSATLDGTARATLDALEIEDVRIVLEGHTDSRGEDDYNLALSRKRALAVQRYLVRRGAMRARVEVRYAGETGAADPDLWRDRRVDITFPGGPR